MAAEDGVAARYVGEVKADTATAGRVPGLFTLLRCGCCELCAFRFLGLRTFSLYREPMPVRLMQRPRAAEETLLCLRYTTGIDLMFVFNSS